MKKSPIVLLISLMLLFLAVLALLWYLLNGCLVNTPVYLRVASNKSVLGASNFDLSSSASSVADNATVNFIATTTTNSSPEGVLAGAVVFQLTGQGRITGNITGPGTCIRVTDLKASCADVLVQPNTTVTWTIPVTAETGCSIGIPTSLTMVGTMTAPLNNFEDTAIVNCVAAAGTGGGTVAPTSSTGGTVNPTTSTGGGATNPTAVPDTAAKVVDNLLSKNSSSDLLALLDEHNNGIKACYTTDMLYVVIGLFVLFLVTLLAWSMMANKEEPVVVSQVK